MFSKLFCNENFDIIRMSRMELKYGSRIELNWGKDWVGVIPFFKDFDYITDRIFGIIGMFEGIFTVFLKFYVGKEK